jgi:hypothetical protein
MEPILIDLHAMPELPEMLYDVRAYQTRDKRYTMTMQRPGWFRIVDKKDEYGSYTGTFDECQSWLLTKRQDQWRATTGKTWYPQ